MISKYETEQVLVSIVIPTYNEAENIVPLLESIKGELERNNINNFEIIVVDDNSPDGTWRLVEEIAKKDPRIKLVRRVNERGLASAVLKGIKEAKGEYVLVMDADFQHPPEIVPRLIHAALKENADVVVASRYSKGGGVEGWNRLRLFISRIATFLAYIMVKESKRTSDPLSGFFLVKRKFVEGRTFRPRGYKILLEILAREPPKNPKVIDVPYVFRNRKSGKSKLGIETMIDYLIHLLDLSKISKFAIVGASGTFVNLGVMALIMKISGSYDIGSISGIEAGILSNFVLNDVWTFEKKFSGNVLGRLFGYHLSSLASAVTTYLTMKILYLLLDINPLLGQLIGILAGFVLNYILSSRIIWRKGYE